MPLFAGCPSSVLAMMRKVWWLPGISPSEVRWTLSRQPDWGGGEFAALSVCAVVVIDCRLCSHQGGDAERVACGVQQNPPLVGVRLEFGPDGSQGEQTGLGGVQVVDAQLYVGLLFLRWLRPGGTAVVGEPIESQAGRAVLAEKDEVVCGEDDWQAKDLSVEAGQLGGVGTVESDCTIAERGY